MTGAVVTYITSATTDAIDGAGVATCLPASGALFAFGDTTVHCTAMDAAGNIAAPKSFVVHVVDTTAPAITLQTPASPTSGASTDFTVIDLFSILSVKCTVNGAGVVDENCSSPFAPLLGDGTYTITISAKDVNGNIVQSTTASFTVDLTAPDVSIDTHPIMPTTSSTDAAFTFHSEAGAILTCALDTTEFSSCSSPFGQPVVEGTHTFTVHATDEAGNVGADSFTWTVDTTAPTVAIIAPTVTDTTGPSGSVTYTVGDGTVVCTLDGEPVDCGNTVASFTGLSDGDHTFTVTSTDTAGNSTSQSVTWHVDAIGPVVTITSGPDEGSTVNTTSATLGFTSEEGATFECQLDDVGFTACESTKTYDTLSDGPHTFKVHATDTYGNVGSDVSRTWTVNTTPATPTCETNQTLVDGHCVTNETPQPPTGGGNGGGGSGGGSSSYDYWGCTNSSAINFNALANKDDGSCQIPGGNGGGTVTPPAAPQGEVLGAATTTGDLALPAACRANPYLRDYLKLGKKNDADQVKMLQTFLNEEMHAQLPVSGFFGSLTKSWVKKLQKTHKAEILQPWVDAGYKSNISDGTGYVYKTTKRFINMTKCAEATIPMPELTPDLGN